MNKQKGPNGRGIEWTDYTWNPVGGCFHSCEWVMPDGNVAKCYAGEVANIFANAYPQGFEHHYWNPERLQEPLELRKPARIFLDSMSDLMGHWVEDEQINEVLGTCRKAAHHTFQLLTKNAPRLKQFTFPSNVWVGISAPPSQMFGARLSPIMQTRFVEVGLKALRETNATTKWMSIEPLSFDIAPLLRNGGLNWVVIGAATRGKRVYQPERAWVENLLGVLDEQNIPVFFKGNLAWAPWREEFPDGLYGIGHGQGGNEQVKPVKQLTMF